MEHTYHLSIRRNIFEDAKATPFHNVLSWLCQSADYFTAASVALNLLNDIDAVRDLRTSPDADEGEDEKSYLEGLLDGIIPVEHQAKNSSFVTSLADMAVGCLIRGGVGMSRTLHGFLGRSSDYDASRASLMLAATSSNAIAEMEEMKSEEGIIELDALTENVVWPIRCLLRIAVTRDVMPMALKLLSATIPDELRCRESNRPHIEGSYRSSRFLCKAIITMIVASAPDSAGILLDLVDGSTCFWQSLSHDTQLSYSLISIGGKYPLLRETEVRTWALENVTTYFEKTMSAERGANIDLISAEWVIELCSAILANAGCHIEQSPSLSVGFVASSEAVDPSENDFENNTLVQRMQMERKIVLDGLILSSPESGGIDFNILIPGLLSIERQSLQWRNGTSLSTQMFLNTVCSIAGKKPAYELDFALDAPLAMKHCAWAENISAAANLIGGTDGLVLKCTNVLIKSLNISIKEAEGILLEGGMISVEKKKIQSSDSSFALTDGHRSLLLLLEDHVLSVKTHGQFDCMALRGGIDPVFAATMCFRVWLYLQQNCQENNHANSWLESWLRSRLGISSNVGSVSKRRLACAVLARSLLWPDEDNLADYNSGAGKQPAVLGEALGLNKQFLVDICKSCCGLVDAVPPSFLHKHYNGGPDFAEENGEYVTLSMQI